MTSSEETLTNKTLRLAEIASENNGKPLLLSLHQLEQHLDQLVAAMGKYDLLNPVNASFRGRVGEIIQAVMKEHGDNQAGVGNSNNSDTMTKPAQKFVAARSKIGYLRGKIEKFINDAEDDNIKHQLLELRQFLFHTTGLVMEMDECNLLKFRNSVPFFSKTTEIAVNDSMEQGRQKPDKFFETKYIQNKE